jgi:gas vesicle protein
MAEDRGNGFMWFLAGLGLGALVGVLYAPKSGRETRQALVDAAQDGREYLTERGTGVRTQVDDWVNRGKEVLSQQKDQFRSAYEAGRQAYNKATTESATEP